MIIERYKRDYVYDDGDMENGFRIANSRYIDGDESSPGFKCVETRHADRLLENMEIEFGREIDCVAMRYVDSSFKKFLNGEKSDWKVTSIQVEPAHLQFCLYNKKLKYINYLVEYVLDCETESRSGYIEVPGAMRLEYFDNIFEYAHATVDVYINTHQFCALELRHKRRDAMGRKEIDYYEITFGLDGCKREYAKVEERHKCNPERRETWLYWANGEGGKPDKNHMLGEVEVYR